MLPLLWGASDTIVFQFGEQYFMVYGKRGLWRLDDILQMAFENVSKGTSTPTRVQ